MTYFVCLKYILKATARVPRTICLVDPFTILSAVVNVYGEQKEWDGVVKLVGVFADIADRESRCDMCHK